MHVRYLFYKILLYVLKSFVYLKRGLFFVLTKIWRSLLYINIKYSKSLGFYLYKIFFYINRFVKKNILLHKHAPIELLSQRAFLQFFLFLVVFIIMIPHSKLYTKEYDYVPGRRTLLYQLVGPGESDFDTEELAGDISFIESSGVTGLWKEGAVVARPGQSGDEKIDESLQEISGVSVGGSAVTKPIIAPGAGVDFSSDTVEVAKRSSVIIYEVKSGDLVSRIAEFYGISVDTILWANGLSARSYIRPGDALKILPADGVLHVVKSGNTISGIAKTYGAKAEDIVKFNKLQLDGSDIVVGEELIIPGGKKQESASRYVQVTLQQLAARNKVVAPPPSISAPAGSGYIWPAAARYITQYYGLRHTGLDIAGDTGVPVYASKSGTVVKSACGWNGGYGCYIILDHGNGIQTLYAHNSQLFVSEGQAVSQGQTISLIGSTGRSTGPHVHFEVRASGRRLNPLRYVRQ